MHIDAPLKPPHDDRLAQPNMTEAEIREWIDACNHEPARRVLRTYLFLISDGFGLGGDKLEAALREAFPHFQDGSPITAERIKSIGAEYLDMVMGWEPSKTELEFQDQDGDTHKIIYDGGVEESGIFCGWIIPEDANWEVRALAQAKGTQA
jgi:hypothetical protein